MARYSNKNRCYWGVTVLLQVFPENIAGLGSLGGVVQGNVSVDVLQKNVNPRLKKTNTEFKSETFFTLVPIVLVFQRRVPEQFH